jgi:hypothetical protein
MSFDINNQPRRRQYAEQTRYGDAYENEREPSEFEEPWFVQFLRYEAGGPYRGKAPRERRSHL